MAKISFQVERCKGCELCVNFCPKKLLKMSDKINNQGYYTVEIIDAEKCTGCRRCFLICPDLVMRFGQSEEMEA